MTPEELADELTDTIQDALDDNSLSSEDARTVLNLLTQNIRDMKL